MAARSQLKSSVVPVGPLRMRRSVLLVAAGQAITLTRRWVLQRAGYSVSVAATTDAALSALKRRSIDVVLMGVSGKAIDFVQVVCATRAQQRKIPIVALGQGRELDADMRLSALAGPEALLRTTGEAVIMAHGHPADPNECIMFVDSLRRYFHVTDAAAEMLGYTREELLGRTIDEISAPDMEVARKFRAYVRDGSQHGVFSLLHRSGDIVHVRYAATVLDDGCMVSRLQKID